MARSVKRLLSREVLWLSLPVVLLGGVAFYQGQVGKWRPLHFFNPFDSGPRRIELSSFETAELKPIDVARGYDWATQTTMGTVGKLNMPASWRDNGAGGTDSPIRLVYRKGAIWKRAPLFKGSSLLSLRLSSFDSGPVTIQANLKLIPRDAEEIRLRGQFQYVHIYRGPIPPGWVSPKNVRHTGLNHWFTISSEVFDLPIKTKDGNWPQPVVSKQQKIEVVEGKWLRNMLGENLLLRVRSKTDSGISGEVQAVVEDLEYFDADGKPLKVYQDPTSTVPSFPSGSTRTYMNYKMPDSEDLVRLAQTTAQPRGGWGKVKMPITITGIVSDGECWPTPFKVSVAPEPGDPRDYGAPSKPTKAPQA